MTRGASVRITDIPGALALLGRAVAVKIKGAARERKFPRGFWLAADPRGGALVIGADRRTRPARGNDRRAARAAARNVREKFHGAASGVDWEILRFPSRWSEIGAASHIVYESSKTNGGGDGKPALFIHKFSPGAVAYESGEFLAILGEKIRVDASGVRN